MKEKRLTVWESACIVTGYGVGGGVMSMPYLTVKTGFLPSMVILAAALFASYVLHLMIAELAVKTEEGGQIISCLSRFLFRGKGKMILTVVFFVLMALILCTNLAAYISGGRGDRGRIASCFRLCGKINLLHSSSYSGVVWS